MKTEQLETLEPFCNKREYGSGDSLEIRREQWQIIRGLNPDLQRTWEALSRFLPEMIDPHYRSSWEERQPSTAPWKSPGKNESVFSQCSLFSTVCLPSLTQP